MRRPEQRLWDRLKDANDALGRPLMLERIENSVGTGRPDVDMLCNGVHRPIELKVVEKLPARVTTPLMGEHKGLNQQQKNWHMEWRRNGGFSLILIGVPNNQIITLSGVHADAANHMTHNQLINAAAFVGPAKATIQFLARPQ